MHRIAETTHGDFDKIFVTGICNVISIAKLHRTSDFWNKVNAIVEFVFFVILGKVRWCSYMYAK